MFLRIDHMLQEPIYLQIRSQIVGAIAREELLPGDALPSVRSLAADLGINLHTVNKAYAVLRDEGYIVMRGRSGARVADLAQSHSEEKLVDAEASLAEALRKLATEYRARGGSEERFARLAADQAGLAFRTKEK